MRDLSAVSILQNKKKEYHVENFVCEARNANRVSSVTIKTKLSDGNKFLAGSGVFSLTQLSCRLWGSFIFLYSSHRCRLPRIMNLITHCRLKQDLKLHGAVRQILHVVVFK